MSDENGANGSEQNTEVQLTEIEQKAAERGWKPKDQWEGDDTQWRDAQTFIDRGELLDTIHSSNRKVKALEQSLKHVTELTKTISVKAYNKALADLKAQQAQAVEDADSDAFRKVTDQIDATQSALNKELQAAEAATQSLGEAEDIEGQMRAFEVKNPWYEANEDAREYAVEQGQLFKAKNPKASFSDMLNYVEAKTKKTFKELSGRKIPSQVDGGSRNTPPGGGRSNKVDRSEFSDFELKVARDMVNSGTFKHVDEYLKLIKESR